MRKITMNGIESLSKEENERITDLVFNKHSNDFHYLAFDRQLSGFSPLGVFIMDFPEIKEKENEIITALLDRHEVESFFPVAKLSLYPVTKIDGALYTLDLDNYEKHFADILELNDAVYNTKYLFVDCGHGAVNLDESLVIDQLSNLLSNSKILEAIFIEDLNS